MSRTDGASLSHLLRASLTDTMYLSVHAVHVALPKRLTNWFEPDQQSRPHALRAYCPHIYTVQGPKGVGKQPVGK